MNARPRRRFLVLSAALALAAVAGGPTARAQQSHEQTAGPAGLVVRDASADLHRTIVSGALSGPHADGQSVLWCSTFQLAWNELAGAMGAPLGFSGELPLADRLNDARESRADLDHDSFVALAGFGRDGILETCREQLKSRFGGAADPRLLPDAIDPESIFAYAYLFKNVSFANPFVRMDEPLLFGGSPTEAFGLWPDSGVEHRGNIARQIVIHAYSSPTEWSVELLAADRGDRLVIARLAPGPTLEDTVGRAMASLDSGDKPGFGNHDQLVVPLMNFDITRRYDELVGRRFTGSSASGVIAGAEQNIRFRLDETGAVLKSESAIEGVTSEVPSDDAKRMVCDGPFLVMMLRAGAAHPYLAVWVDNSELLVARN